MTPDDLKTIVAAEISNSAGYIGGELADQRARAMDYYLQEPYGNEVEGRSHVVTSEVMDTVEWIQPSLLKTFAGSDQAVRFDPEGPEDEEAAEQETDYCNYVFYKDNPGFLILYTWFKDALLSKNGVVKCYWDESTKIKREEYKGLTDDEFLLLSQDEELEPIEHTEEAVIEIISGPDGLPVQQQSTSHDVVFKRTRKIGKVTVAPVPPERFLINRDHNSLLITDARFTGHWDDIPASDLIEQGYDPEQLKEVAGSDSVPMGEEETARKNLDDEQTYDARTDEAMRTVRKYECYLRVDYDGDGIAELRKIGYAGNQILKFKDGSLDIEEVDRHPFEAITPIILTHKFFGLSVADIVMDLQQIKSVLMRQMLDNLYLTNNPMREVVEGQVNLDDALASRPGGLVRVKQPGMINNIEIPFVAGQSLTMMEYLDKIRFQRAGVSENTMGQNQALSNDTAHGLERLMSAAEQRVELIARIFAETGVKGLFLQIRELLQKHQDKAKVIKLRNKWVNVDPREWRERANMTIKVGLGTGDRMKQQAAIGAILDIQERVAAQGGMGTLLQPKNIYNAANDFAKFSGLNSAEAYFTDPDTVQQQTQQEQPNPLAEAEQIKGQFKLESDQMQAQMKAQIEQMKNESQMKTEMLRLQIEQMNRDADRRSREAIETMKAEMQAIMKGIQMDLGKPGIAAGVQS